MRRVIVIILVLGLALPAGLFPASASPEVSDAVVHTLTYVESSYGLTPPQLEGGRTEVEMGDVNGDGYLDLVSIGDHGSPYVNADEHGVMVWFGDGAGHWAVSMNGNLLRRRGPGRCERRRPYGCWLWYAPQLFQQRFRRPVARSGVGRRNGP